MTHHDGYPDLADRWSAALAGREMTPDQARYAAAFTEWEAAKTELADAAQEGTRLIDAADARWNAAEAALRACEIRPGIPRPECVILGKHRFDATIFALMDNYNAGLPAAS